MIEQKPGAGRILIVDDTPENLAVLTQVLRGEGYEVLSVLSGRRALQAARREAPDLVLLDVQMPEMDGYETCRRFKADDALKTIPIVFISAATDTPTRERIGPDDPAHRRAHDVIGDILSGKVTKPAREAVRRALDKADAPLTGRAASDAGLGRAIRFAP